MLYYVSTQWKLFFYRFCFPCFSCCESWSLWFNHFENTSTQTFSSEMQQSTTGLNVMRVVHAGPSTCYLYTCGSIHWTHLFIMCIIFLYAGTSCPTRSEYFVRGRYRRRHDSWQLHMFTTDIGWSCSYTDYHLPSTTAWIVVDVHIMSEITAGHMKRSMCVNSIVFCVYNVFHVPTAYTIFKVLRSFMYCNYRLHNTTAVLHDKLILLLASKTARYGCLFMHFNSPTLASSEVRLPHRWGSTCSSSPARSCKEDA